MLEQEQYVPVPALCRRHPAPGRLPVEMRSSDFEKTRRDVVFDEAVVDEFAGSVARWCNGSFREEGLDGRDGAGDVRWW